MMKGSGEINIGVIQAVVMVADAGFSYHGKLMKAVARKRIVS
jgi:hypothetical protein